MGLAYLLGIADLHCQKVKSTKWLKTKTSKTGKARSYLDSMENNAAVHSGSGAVVVAWKYCLSKIQGGGPLELLDVAENGRFAW